MRAVVIGGGIGGATAALALAEVGVEVEVHEAGARPVEDRGWVTLGPAAMTGLDQVGVADSVRAVGFPVTKVRNVDIATGAVSGFARSEPTHRYTSTHVWRQDLVSILRNQLEELGVPCHYDSAATAADLDGDVIVGADGARSATRRSLGNLVDPAYTGEIIRYGHHPSPVAGLPTGVLHFWRHRTGVAGYVGDARDGSFWFSRHQSDSPTSTIDLPTMIAPLRDTPVATALDSSWVSRPIALYDLDPTDVWHRGHTVVIGDAAHALSPAAGRGATSSIEDAIILAKHLRQHQFAVYQALESFTSNRRPIALAAYRPTPGQRPVAATAEELDLRAQPSGERSAAGPGVPRT
ncbi:FAD-dependent oxidoreductase [Pseudonocardia alaniniphila]|uniref:FAD-dependent monooxygenase n=1 Tax=Pseudonocardia alaniniphila TaxID=75291 RepID=A0ABS9TQZ5_9PSEU|nr:NAD(P)/FAD-dependent oxidoreductase [Pseudonocardia alaniniphila]MCH6170646.1 FAD-dependent monooxygenase [Pseudonocardia alaniniphila]